MSSPVTITMANMISGVSQQPDSLRLSTSAKAMTNAWPSVVSGLNKRPPTEFIAPIDSDFDDAVCHSIDHGDTYRYIIALTRDDIQILDTNGVKQSVNFPYGKSYINQAPNPIEDIKFLTVNDTTFVLNKRMRVLPRPIAEGGTTDYVPDVTVATQASLPEPSVIGKVAYVSGEGRYYRYEHREPIPPTYNWVMASSWIVGFPPDDKPNYPLGTSPAAAAPGQQFYAYGDAYAEPDGYSNLTNPYGVRLVRSYALYEYRVVNPGEPARDGWFEVTLADVATVEGDRISPQTLASFFVTQSVANANYNIYFDNILMASYTTQNGTSAAASVEGTDVIATQLAQQLVVKGYDVNVFGSTLVVKNLPSTRSITSTGSSGDKCLRCYRGSVNSFSDLPPNEIEGRVLKVKGEVKTNGDDYYVRYRKGIWEETSGYDQQGSLEADTMPHVLIREEDGSWSFRPHNWQRREAGDEDSNPDPSFVGETLSDIFIYTNRLGFLAADNVVLSEANQFENFYRTSLTQVLDSDPVDFSVISKISDTLNHAIQFNKDLLLMGSQSQQRLTYQNFVGPKNVSSQFTTSFNCSPYITPINMGSSVYFVDDRAGYNYAKLWEYFPRDNQTGDDADEVTSPIPRYIPSGVKWLAASPRVKTVVLFSKQTPDTLYVYKFFWANDKKVQNAWGTWQFPGALKLCWGGFVNNYLYVLVKRADGTFLERLRVDEEVFDSRTGSRVLLDRLFRGTVQDLTYNTTPLMYNGVPLRRNQFYITYNAITNRSTLKLPYPSATINVVAAPLTGQTSDAFWRAHTFIDSETVEVEGDLSLLDVYMGVPYVMTYEYSTQFVRQAKNGGEVVLLEPRLQLRYLNLEYHDAAYFQVDVKLPGRQVVSKGFDGIEAGIKVPATGSFRVPILCRNLDSNITILNDSPFNSSFSTTEFTGIFAPKTQRV